MVRLSITHQAWLLSAALLFVLMVLTYPLLSKDNNSEYGDTVKVGEHLSAVFRATGIEGITSEFAKLATNVFVEVKDSQGKTIASNIKDSRTFFISNAEKKASVLYHYETVKLTKQLSAHIVVREVQTIPDNPWLMAILFLGSLVVAALMSFLWGNLIQRRLQKINQLTSQIIHSGNVSLRLSPSQSSKDFEVLEDNLNAMLTKIETLMINARQTGDAIAHDLRGPLTRLKHKLETISPDSSTLIKQLNEVHDEIDHMVTIFNTLLRLSIIESGKQLIKLEPVSICRLIHDAIELYEPLAQEKNIIFIMNTHEATVMADKQLLFQALANVIDNAIKFSSDAGEISVQTAMNQNFIVITVADRGMGVSLQEMQKLSERFYRADKSRTKSGTGLGLSLVKAIVQLHQGQLTFSDNAPGLTVQLSLPLIDNDKLY